MKLNIAVCDDEQQQTEAMRSAVQAWAQKNSHLCSVSVFFSAEAFLFEYDREKLVCCKALGRFLSYAPTYHLMKQKEASKTRFDFGCPLHSWR